MVDVASLITQFKSILPAQIQDFWYLVIAILILILLLIIVNIGKLFKGSSPQVTAFKAQNSPPPLGSMGGTAMQRPNMPFSGQTMQARPPQGVMPMHHGAMVEHNVHTPHKDFKQLDQYIKAQLDAGFDITVLRNNLIAVGWRQQDIDTSIANVQSEIAKIQKEISK